MQDRNYSLNLSLKTALWIIMTVILLWLTFILRDVIVILLLSFIFAAAVDPVVDRLQKRKIPRAVSIVFIYLLVVAAISLIIRTIIPPALAQITDLTNNKEFYIDKFTSYIHALSPSLRESIKQSAISAISSFTSTAGGGLLSGAISLFNGIFAFILVLVISFYLLLEKDGTEKVISSYVPKQYHSKALSVAKKITAKMGAWFRGELLLGFIIFVITYIGLTILNVDFALTLAIIAGFLELLPVVGPFIAGGLAALVALTSSPFLALIVVVFYLLIQQLENNILVPQVMKKTVGLHPVAIIIALLAGGKLLGVLGVIIAVPVAAALSVLINEFYKINLGGN